MIRKELLEFGVDRYDCLLEELNQIQFPLLPEIVREVGVYLRQ
jgi:hypothetical protein